MFQKISKAVWLPNSVQNPLKTKATLYYNAVSSALIYSKLFF